MIKIAIVLGSTRPGRKSEAVGKWVLEHAQKRTDASFELVDLREHPLPLLDEPKPPSLGQYEHAHTKAWSEKVSAYDGYLFITPEYNHGPPAALKNALDYVYKEWNNKAAAFVGYGSLGAARSVEQMRLILAELQVATVRAQVALLLATDFENYTTFKPAERHAKTLTTVFDQLIAWAGALKPLRQ